VNEISEPEESEAALKSLSRKSTPPEVPLPILQKEKPKIYNTEENPVPPRHIISEEEIKSVAVKEKSEVIKTVEKAPSLEADKISTKSEPKSVEKAEIEADKLDKKEIQVEDDKS
jgi:hypothetical protein